MPKRHNKTSLIHEVVEHAGVLYVAGQVGESSAGMGIQTTQALDAIGALLDANGSDKASLLQATVYITDFSLKGEMNESWAKFFGDHSPTRATIGVADLGAGILIEIVVVAARKA